MELIFHATFQKTKRLLAIYNQIWANPLISISEIAQKTNMEMNTVSEYLAEMNRKFMGGPVICMNPAENYHHYTYFLKVDDPLSVYREFGKPPVISRWLGVGSWNILLISEKCIDISQLRGLKILHGLKSGTQFSKVSTASWDQSLKKMYSAIDTPEEKSYLYEEGPAIPWKEWEWSLYHRLRNNVRIPVNSILEKLEIHHAQYKKWVHSLPAYAHFFLYLHMWDLCFAKINEKIKEFTLLSFAKINEKIKEFTPTQRKFKPTLPYSTWGHDEWKLYHAFKSNMRQKITPTLRKINVRYETYREWINILDTHCTTHTEFYPEGYKTYLNCCFLLSSDHASVTQSLFSLFPISSRTTNIGEQLFVSTHLPFPYIATRVFCTIYDLKTAEMIKKYKQAVVLSSMKTSKE